MASNKLEIDPGASSLFTILDDKNSIIEILKKQVQNQKMQLKYYIRKELRPPTIKELSKTCCFQSLEDSVPVGLAMNKFLRQSGGKTKMMALHERMSRMDRKISYMLNSQQHILREIVKAMCRYVHEEADTSWFTLTPKHVDLFNRLLYRTMTLSKALDIFRICCNRLIVTEDEKNTIVEQVYSLPIKERVNCNYLVSIHMERLKLETEIKKILKDQHTLKNRVKEIMVLDKQMKHVQFSDNDDEEVVANKLQTLNNDALEILEKSVRQKQKFENDLQVSSRRFKMRKVVQILKYALEQLRLQNYTIPSEYSEEERELYEGILTMLDLQINVKAIKQYVSIVNQCKLLQSELQNHYNEREKLMYSMNLLEEELQKLKVRQASENLNTTREKNTFKETKIRDATTQFVNGTVPLETSREDMKEKNLKIFELQSANKSLQNERKKFKDVISRNKSQIMYLLKIINGHKYLTSNTQDSGTDNDNTQARGNSKVSVTGSVTSIESSIRHYMEAEKLESRVEPERQSSDMKTKKEVKNLFFTKKSDFSTADTRESFMSMNQSRSFVESNKSMKSFQKRSICLSCVNSEDNYGSLRCYRDLEIRNSLQLHYLMRKGTASTPTYWKSSNFSNFIAKNKLFSNFKPYTYTSSGSSSNFLSEEILMQDSSKECVAICCPPKHYYT